MRRYQNNVFTLIELVVVLSILVVLCTLLITALNTVNKRTNLIDCTHKLGNISYAINAYLHDNNQYFPNFNIWTDTLNHYLGSDEEDPKAKYFCPEADFKSYSNGWQYREGSYSYSQNAGHTPWIAPVRLPHINNPNDKLITIDGGGSGFFSSGAVWRASHGNYGAPDAGNWYADCIRAPHFDKTNSLFIDGRIDQITLEKYDSKPMVVLIPGQ